MSTIQDPDIYSNSSVYGVLTMCQAYNSTFYTSHLILITTLQWVELSSDCLGYSSKALIPTKLRPGTSPVNTASLHTREFVIVKNKKYLYVHK